MEDAYDCVHRLIRERHRMKSFKALNSAGAQFRFVCCGPLGVLFGLAVGTFIASVIG